MSNQSSFFNGTVGDDSPTYQDVSASLQAAQAAAALAGTSANAAGASAAQAQAIVAGVIGGTSWAPVLRFGGSSTGITFSHLSGNWFRLGQLVFYRGAMILSSKGTATGAATIVGLPFLPSSNGNFAVGVGFSANFIGLTGPVTPVLKSNLSPSGQIDIYNGSSDNSAPVITDANFSNITNLYFNGFYVGLPP